MFDLAGQVAVVTGASGGVGSAITRGLARQGVELCLIGRQLEALEAFACSLDVAPSHVHCYKADLARQEEICRLAAALHESRERIDILVHSAGVIELGRTGVASVEALERQYHINVRAPYVLTQALLPTLRSCMGQIVFINSSVGMNARAGVGQYAATKHALRAVADSLREEINPDGVRVLSVFLGRTATPMQTAVHRAEGRAYDPTRLLQPDDVAAVVINALGLPRTAEVTDIHIRPFRGVS